MTPGPSLVAPFDITIAVLVSTGVGSAGVVLSTGAVLVSVGLATMASCTAGFFTTTLDRGTTARGFATAELVCVTELVADSGRNTVVPPSLCDPFWISSIAALTAMTPNAPTLAAGTTALLLIFMARILIRFIRV